MLRTLAAALIAVVLAGCASTRRGPDASGVPGIHHVVLVTLHDPADADALIADCDRRLAVIPSVADYWRGTTIDVGRSNVLQDFHVGLHFLFADEDAYAAYVEHPDHVGLVAAWRDRVARLDVRDVRN